MKIASLFHRTVTSCADRDCLDFAASLMWRHNIGCLPVVGDSGQLIGMLTDRDIALAAFLQGSPLRAITVSSVMRKELITCTADDDVEQVLKTMIAHRLRRVPVVDQDGRLVGILSLNDIARAAMANELSPSGMTSVVAAMAVPRSLAAVQP